MLNIEGLGRQLDPNLDLWQTAKPYLENWMAEQVGWQGLYQRLKAEAPRYAQIFPQLPRLLHRALEQQGERPNDNTELLTVLIHEQQKTNRLLSGAAWTVALVVLALASYEFWPHFAG
jgi:ubiquinone biosynthesis protein